MKAKTVLWNDLSALQLSFRPLEATMLATLLLVWQRLDGGGTSTRHAGMHSIFHTLLEMFASTPPPDDDVPGTGAKERQGMRATEREHRHVRDSM